MCLLRAWTRHPYTCRVHNNTHTLTQLHRNTLTALQDGAQATYRQKWKSIFTTLFGQPTNALQHNLYQGASAEEPEDSEAGSDDVPVGRRVSALEAAGASLLAPLPVVQAKGKRVVQAKGKEHVRIERRLPMVSLEDAFDSAATSGPQKSATAKPGNAPKAAAGSAPTGSTTDKPRNAPGKKTGKSPHCGAFVGEPLKQFHILNNSQHCLPDPSIRRYTPLAFRITEHSGFGKLYRSFHNSQRLTLAPQDRYTDEQSCCLDAMNWLLGEYFLSRAALVQRAKELKHALERRRALRLRDLKLRGLATDPEAQLLPSGADPSEYTKGPVQLSYSAVQSMLAAKGIVVKQTVIRGVLHQPASGLVRLMCQPTGCYLVEFFWFNKETDNADWHVIAGTPTHSHNLCVSPSKSLFLS